MDYRLTTPEGSSNPIFLGFTPTPPLDREGAEQRPQDGPAAARALRRDRHLLRRSATWITTPSSPRRGRRSSSRSTANANPGLIGPVPVRLRPDGQAHLHAGRCGARNIGQLRFTTNTRDPRWDFTAPADGEYAVQVRDLYHQQRGDIRFTYRLSIRRPQPDFRLIVVPKHDVQPDATVVGRGGKHWMDVLAFRKDGFDGPIRVEARPLPPGVTCDPVVIGPGKTSAPLVFHAAKDTPLGHAAIRVTGKADIDDREVVAARGGGLTWPTVNTPGIARMADSIVLAVRRPAPFAVTAVPARTELAAGEKLSISVKVERSAGWAESVQLSGFDLPDPGHRRAGDRAEGRQPGQGGTGLPRCSGRARTRSPSTVPARPPMIMPASPIPKGRGGRNVRAVFPSNPITITVNPGGKAKR